MAHHRAVRSRPPFHPSKRLGQHFLVSAAVSGNIIRLGGFRPSDVVLEIGAGQGALTLPLSRAVSHVAAVEKDAHLVDFLEKRLSTAGISNVTLVCHDILSLNLETLPFLGSGKIQVIGNLPYNISSPVLEKLIQVRQRVARAVLMFQLEVAKRLTASPCSKGYGALTLLIRYHARPTCLLGVPRDAFYPVPKVDSMVVELDFERPYPSHGVSEGDFKKIVKGAFAHRRKTLLNSLRGSLRDLPPAVLLKGLNACGIDPARRAETLTMDEFLMLASTLAVDNRKTD